MHSALVKCGPESKFIDFTHQPCFSMLILFGNHWMYSTMICVETKRTLFRTQVATHCMFIIMTVIITVSRRFLLLFCFFFSIRVVYACDFQFALFTLVHFLFVHTYRKAFTNINNNNTFELIFVLSRLGFRFVSILVFSLTTHLKLWNEFEFCFQ